MTAVRWDRLFDDLEAQFEAEAHAAAAADLADLVRAERAGLSLADRLRAHVDARLGWHLRETSLLEAELLDLGADWLLLRWGRRELVVALPAVLGVQDLARPARQDGGAVARRLGIGSVLRRLAQDRAEVQLRLAGGPTPGEEVSGTIDRVGADHVDLAEHPRGSFRRAQDVTRVRTVGFGALVWISTDG